MLDCYNRNINYLRISVTDRCNLHCHYCMPDAHIHWLRQSQLLSFEQIVAFARVAAELGITKVRLTGGEPLVRRGITDLVRQLAGIHGLTDLTMTTNGLLLEEFATKLAEAGLQRVNVSLDTVDPDKYRLLTGSGDLISVLRGIEAARKAGLNPVKINCVISETVNEPDAAQVAEFCKDQQLEVRFIRRMDLKNGYFYGVNGGTGGRCNICNRIRLTANGKVKPCLFSENEYDLRQLGAKEAILAAIENKPMHGDRNQNGYFYNIGG